MRPHNLPSTIALSLKPLNIASCDVLTQPFSATDSSEAINRLRISSISHDLRIRWLMILLRLENHLLSI